jgi:hypothetical protein
MARPYIYIYIFFFHCTDIWPQLRTRCAGDWRGSSAEHLCWRRPAVRWLWGRTGPFRRAPPATTPSPSEPSRQVRPFACGRWGATVPALEVRRRYEQVRWNHLQTDLSIPGYHLWSSGCYPSSKAAGAMPKWAPSVGTHAYMAGCRITPVLGLWT